MLSPGLVIGLNHPSVFTSDYLKGRVELLCCSKCSIATLNTQPEKRGSSPRRIYVFSALNAMLLRLGIKKKSTGVAPRPDLGVINWHH